MVKLSKQVAVIGLLFFGTSCSILAKLIYSVEAPTLYGTTERFEKPWFQVLAMFVGMSACVLLDKKKSSHFSGENNPLASRGMSSTGSSASIWILNIPTLCDLFATACGTTGLLYTNVSVYQMLRGAMLIFTAIFSIIFLKAKLKLFNWLGILSACCGIVIVGGANILSQDNADDKSNMIFGVLIIVLGQIIQATQMILEEYCLSDLDMPSIRIVAWEGIFGVMHCLLWVLPLAYFIPGKDHGSLEDSPTSFYMLTHTWKVFAIVLTDMTMMLCYNVCGMEVTSNLTAVHRVILETLRTLCIWIFDLFVFYAFGWTSVGEKWTIYSWFQLLGFILLVCGTVLYNYDQLFGGQASVETYKAASLDIEERITSAAVTATEYGTTPPQAFADNGHGEEVYGSSITVMPFGSPIHGSYIAAAGTPASFIHSHMHGRD